MHAYSKGHDLTFQILPNDVVPLLSAQTCSKLGLVELRAKLEASPTKSNLCYNKNDQLIDQYKDTYSGLGCLPGQYHIDIDETFPPVQHAPQRVPIRDGIGPSWFSPNPKK